MRRTDAPAIRDICVRCAWMGEPAGDRIPGERLWAEFWTRWFTDHQRHHAWVACQAHTSQPVGYLLGTPDARAAERFLPFLLPRLVWAGIRDRVLRRPASRRALRALAGSLLAGELALPADVRQNYPATFHLNLLAAARGGGLGRALTERFLDHLRAEGVAGLHVQTLSLNEPINRFCVSQGFRLIARRELTAFRYAEERPIDILTWVRAV